MYENGNKTGIMSGDECSSSVLTAPPAELEITGDVIYIELQLPVTKDSIPPAYKPNGEPCNLYRLYPYTPKPWRHRCSTHRRRAYLSHGVCLACYILCRTQGGRESYLSCMPAFYACQPYGRSFLFRPEQCYYSSCCRIHCLRRKSICNYGSGEVLPFISP